MTAKLPKRTNKIVVVVVSVAAALVFATVIVLADPFDTSQI